MEENHNISSQRNEDFHFFITLAKTFLKDKEKKDFLEKSLQALQVFSLVFTIFWSIVIFLNYEKRNNDLKMDLNELEIAIKSERALQIEGKFNIERIIKLDDLNKFYGKAMLSIENNSSLTKEITSMEIYLYSSKNEINPCSKSIKSNEDLNLCVIDEREIGEKSDQWVKIYYAGSIADDKYENDEFSDDDRGKFERGGLMTGLIEPNDINLLEINFFIETKKPIWLGLIFQIYIDQSRYEERTDVVFLDNTLFLPKDS